jgi:hypothetical protein
MEIKDLHSLFLKCTLYLLIPENKTEFNVYFFISGVALMPILFCSQALDKGALYVVMINLLSEWSSCVCWKHLLKALQNCNIPS